MKGGKEREREKIKREKEREKEKKFDQKISNEDALN